MISASGLKSVARRGSKARGIPQKPKRSGIAPPRGLIAIVILLGAWQLLGSSESFTYPPPGNWFSALADLQSDHLLLVPLGKTFQTFAFGLGLSIAAGVVAGGLIGASMRADRAMSPVMDFFRALPPPAVVSVVLLTLGLGYSSALLMVVIGSVWPIVLNTAAGMRSVPAIRLEATRTIGLSTPQYIWKAVLPSLLPNAFLGIKVAASIAFVITLFIEILGVTPGMGSLLVERQQRFDSAGVWGILFIVGCCGYLINVGVQVLERIVLRNWPQEGR